MQSGAWNVSVINSSGWVVSIANTIAGGSLVSINNSAGWIVNVANTGGSVVVSNTQTAINIINSAGWVISQANTAGITVNVINSAGWIISQANTAGMSSYALDSAALGTVTTNIASTIGTVVLAASQPKRVNLAIYNASTQPMYMKLGSGAKATDFTLMMVGSAYYELPRPVYNGQITGVWPTADGFAMISEST